MISQEKSPQGKEVVQVRRMRTGKIGFGLELLGGLGISSASAIGASPAREIVQGVSLAVIGTGVALHLGEFLIHSSRRKRQE